MPLLVIFVVAVLHVAACPGDAVAASDRSSHLSSDLRVSKARALVKSGRFHEALASLRPLAPDKTDVLFLSVWLPSELPDNHAQGLIANSP